MHSDCAHVRPSSDCVTSLRQEHRRTRVPRGPAACWHFPAAQFAALVSGLGVLGPRVGSRSSSLSSSGRRGASGRWLLLRWLDGARLSKELRCICLLMLHLGHEGIVGMLCLGGTGSACRQEIQPACKSQSPPCTSVQRGRQGSGRRRRSFSLVRSAPQVASCRTCVFSRLGVASTKQRRNTGPKRYRIHFFAYTKTEIF